MIDSNLYSMLVTQTWQVAAVALIVWILARTIANNRPHLAHALWVLVLIKVLTPPVWTSPTSPFCWIVASSSQQQTEPEAPAPAAGFRFMNQNHSQNAVASTNAFSIPPVEPGTWPVDTFNQDAESDNSPSTENSFALPGPASMPNWSRIFTRIWIAGAMVGLVILLIRYLWFVWWMSRTREMKSSEIAELARQLSKKLGLRTGVRVRILESPVGPVVLGLLRPTVVLPAAIVRGKSPDELAPLTAHELIHYRRGDLWWALVQALAKNLFWFHPLVHLAERRVTREAERSCDEETIASLGCSSAAYARCLLGVLEQKHQLRVAPALPGVRPVDITSARLERVMKLGNGIHQKSPAWVWLVMLLGCAIILPGAAMVWAQEKTGTPNQIEDGQLRLKSRFAFSKVVASTTIDAPSDNTAVPAKAQRPTIVLREMNCETEFPRGNSLAILVSDSEEQRFLFVVDSVTDKDRLNRKSQVSTTAHCFSFAESAADGQRYQIMDTALIHSPVRDIAISTGKKTRFRFAFDIPEMAIGDRQMVKFDMVSPKDIDFTGLKPGTTTCSVKTPDGSLMSFDVVVKDEVLPGLVESPPPQVSLTAKIGMRCSVQLQHEIDKIDVIDKTQIEVQKLGDFQILLKPRKPGNSKILLTQKDGSILQLNVSVEYSTAPAANLVVCCNDDDRTRLKDCRIVHFGSQSMALTQGVTLERTEDRAVVSGDNFSLFVDGINLATAAFGKLEVSDKSDSFDVTLTGKTNLKLSENMAMKADQIRFATGRGNGPMQLELVGNAELNSSEPTFADGRSIDATADRIWLDGETLKFEGNVRIIAKPSDGQEKTYEGDKIHISESGEIHEVETEPNTDNPSFRVIQLAHIKPEAAKRIIEELFDERKRKSLRLSVAAKKDQILVKGSPKVLNLVEEILRKVDVVLEPNIQIKIEGNSIKFEKIHD